MNESTSDDRHDFGTGVGALWAGLSGHALAVGAVRNPMDTDEAQVFLWTVSTPAESVVNFTAVQARQLARQLLSAADAADRLESADGRSLASHPEGDGWGSD